MTAIMFSPRIGPVSVDCWITETHISTIGITEIPVESGARITDHAYVEPKRLSIDFGNEQAALTYMTLVKFQESRIPFTIVSGLSVYNNMLIRSINAQRDPEMARVFRGTVELQEIIIVNTAAAPASSSAGGGGNKAATPTKETTTGDAVKDKASGTVTRGDQPNTPVIGYKHLMPEVTT
jgi:hypothetical protein